jgi:hypothetical protein
MNDLSKDPLGKVASQLLEYEKADDVLIIVTDRKGRMDLSNATTDLSFTTIEEQRNHVLRLIEAMLKQLKSDAPCEQGTYTTNGTDVKDYRDNSKKESSGDDSISMNE